jgi:hypothetical protein
VAIERETTLTRLGKDSDFSNQARVSLVRKLYLLGLFLWLCLTVFFPPWEGRIYIGYGNGVVEEGGAFGLRGVDGCIKYAPLWRPPLPHSTVIVATPRLPWQPIQPGYHVDLALALMATQYSLGVIALGFALLITHRWILRRKPDIFVSTAFWFSLLLSLALLCIVVVGLLTMGYALTEGVIVGIWMFGVLAAVVLAVARLLLSLRASKY